MKHLMSIQGLTLVKPILWSPHKRPMIMTIYSGALGAGYATVRLTVGDETHTLPVIVKPGKLVVRGFQEQTVYTIADREINLSSDTITALVPANTNYFINREDVQLTDPEDARLLVDRVIQGDALVSYLRELHSSQTSEERFVYVPHIWTWSIQPTETLI